MPPNGTTGGVFIHKNLKGGVFHAGFRRNSRTYQRREPVSRVRRSRRAVSTVSTHNKAAAGGVAQVGMAAASQAIVG